MEKPRFIFLQWNEMVEETISLYYSSGKKFPECAFSIVKKHTAGLKTTPADIKLSVRYICSLAGKRRSEKKASVTDPQIYFNFMEDNHE